MVLRKTFSTYTIETDRERIKAPGRDRSPLPIILPWGWPYKSWWGVTVAAASSTVFVDTYQIAFSGGALGRTGLILEVLLFAVFGIDIVINFNLAYYDEHDEIIFARGAIAKNYMKRMFWVDLLGVVPFYIIAMAATGQLTNQNQLTQRLAFLRLFKMIRLYRVSTFFSNIKYSSKISLINLTLLRNFSAAMVWTHLWACVMFFIARQSDFDPDSTWLGIASSDMTELEMTELEQYITSLYWSVVTFTTVGYGDFSPVNSVEQIFGLIYMLLNVVLMAWIIGSITLLIVKEDEKTSVYRETLYVLRKYSTIHNFDSNLTKRLKTHLKLEFESREIADEKVLHLFPAGIRRKILRRLYMPSLLKTDLMVGARQQFVDAFLSLCSVEVFTPGEELLQRGSISPDLYLLLEGTAEVRSSSNDYKVVTEEANSGDIAETTTVAPTIVADSTAENRSSCRKAKQNQIESGDFLNEIGFFTESPQIETVRTRTVCKCLTMSRPNYKSIAADYPSSAGVVLRNLLSKLENLPQSNLSLSSLTLSLPLSSSLSKGWDDPDAATVEVHVRQALTSVRDLVKMNINKQRDDHTTRFCFAASRGDAATIAAMCDQGFDPDSADYDKRTALMVASMNGNADAVTKLLECGANPNLTDMHGTSALYEATRNGHENVAAILLEHGGELSMNENLAASTLCQAVSDGDTLLLRRLLRADIQVNASDYDRRTASHIAASEGNLAAFKLLAEAGADWALEDRWGNTARSEAERAKSGQVLEYIMADHDTRAACSRERHR